MMDTDGGNFEIFCEMTLLLTGALTVALVTGFGGGAGRGTTMVVGVAMVTGLTAFKSLARDEELDDAEDLFVT